MTPTNKLRFVERKLPLHPMNNVGAKAQTIRVLQQWFRKEPLGMHPEYVGEWRDVPMEKEDA